MENNTRLIENDDYWTFIAHDPVVNTIIIDNAFGMELGEEEDSVSIRINGSFRVRKDGSEVLLHPKQTEEMGQVLSVLHASADLVRIYKIGNLELNFSNGLILEVEPDSAGHTWEIANSGMFVFCTEDGDVSIWRK
ncbi:MAG: DUF6188 family protein [Ignavibacteriales bacterium]